VALSFETAPVTRPQK